jgi:hypothetical protein
MVAGGIFEIGIEDADRVVRVVSGATVVDNEKFVLSKDAFDVIAVFWVAHDDGDKVEMVLFGSVGKFGRLRGRDIVGKRDAIVTSRCGARETGDHAIDFFGVGHIAPDEEPTFLERVGFGN